MPLFQLCNFKICFDGYFVGIWFGTTLVQNNTSERCFSFLAGFFFSIHKFVIQYPDDTSKRTTIFLLIQLCKRRNDRILLSSSSSRSMYRRFVLKAHHIKLLTPIWIIIKFPYLTRKQNLAINKVNLDVCVSDSHHRPLFRLCR